MGLFRGNMDSQAPFIIQISKGARAYTDKRMLEAMIRAADDIWPDALFAVHLDHRPPLLQSLGSAVHLELSFQG